MSDVIYDARIDNCVQGSKTTRILQDRFEHQANQALTAHVRSGDYFSTLATVLDGVASKLPENSDEFMLLEQCVRDLLYIDDVYRIVPK